MASVKANVPYVFLHPAWRGAWCWYKVLAVMEAWGREAYGVECPGHGSRLEEIEDVALADYPRAVVEFIEERGLDRVVLVGNSTGGLVCQLMAQEIPDRIAHTYDFVPVRNSCKNADTWPSGPAAIRSSSRKLSTTWSRGALCHGSCQGHNASGACRHGKAGGRDRALGRRCHLPWVQTAR